LASGDSEYTVLLFEHGAIETLLALLKSQHIEVIEQAIWCLGNMGGDSRQIRDAIIYAGVIQQISNILLKTPNLSRSFQRNASWTLANLCRGRPSPSFDHVKDAIPALAKILLENDSEETITDILWAFSYISDNAGNELS